MPGFIIKRIVKNVTKNSCIGILGLAFKPGSDDVRDTPSAKIIRQLLYEGYCNIIVYDPIAIDNFKNQYTMNVEYCSELKQVVDKADELVVLTAWDEFKKLPVLTDKTIVDCRYMF